MNNCKGITADSIKKDLFWYSKNTKKLYDLISNKCKLKFPLNTETNGTLLHAIAVGNFVSPRIKNISTDFNNLITYINNNKRNEFVKILSQIDLNNLKTVGGKTPLDLAITAGTNKNVKNRDTVLLFKTMLEEAIALRSSNKNTNSTISITNSTISKTNSTKSITNATSTTNSKSKNQLKEEITSVICSHESRIKCYLKKFGIMNYTKDKIVKIEFYNSSVQKIEIENSSVYKKNSMKRINNNVKRISNNMNYKYIFYIFSCQTDDYAKNNKINSDPSYNSVNRTNTNGLTVSEKKTVINSLAKIKQSLPENPDYLFSSDLKRSMIDIIHMYPNKEIIVLPCCHPTSDELNRCNGIPSSFKNTPGQNSLRNNIIWIYYENFYSGKRRTGKILSNNPTPTSGIFSRLSKMQIKIPAFGRKHCSNTTFIDEVVEIIKKEKLAETSYNIKY